MPVTDILTEVMSEFSEGRRQGIAQDHEEHMQVDEFYREVGIKKLEQAVTFWTHYFVNTDQVNKDMHNGSLARNLQKNKELILVYGSSRTIHDFAVYQQRAYTSSSDGKDRSPYEMMIFFAQIIVDLKYDFTGIRTNVIDLLRVQINDLKSGENEEKAAEAYRTVMKLLGVPKAERKIK